VVHAHPRDGLLAHLCGCIRGNEVSKEEKGERREGGACVPARRRPLL
jgi:hypothetical protein